jgi:RNA polymerase sigma factor (TIGR02999 family)
MSEQDVTTLLKAWGAGDAKAAEALLPRIYSELHALAGHFMRRERPGHTLQSTALVHEAYLRLIDKREVVWQDRAHFLALAAREMRRVLVEHARARRAEKRGGGVLTLTLHEEDVRVLPRDVELLALDEALQGLESVDGQQARIVELRYFGGLTVEEMALVVGVSTATVDRKWRSARAWLYSQLVEDGQGQ